MIAKLHVAVDAIFISPRKLLKQLHLQCLVSNIVPSAGVLQLDISILGTIPDQMVPGIDAH